LTFGLMNLTQCAWVIAARVLLLAAGYGPQSGRRKAVADAAAVA
jgi:hypothetical protein